MSDSGAPHPPLDLAEIRGITAPARWGLFETASERLSALEEVVVWGRLYDASGISLEELSAWADVVRRFSGEIASALIGAVAESGDEELEEMVYWSSRQIEGNLRQPLTILEKREGEARDSAFGWEVAEDRWPLCSALADVVGRLRNELRRLAAFVVAADRWDIDRVEAQLFPSKHEELDRSRRLKEGLIALLESFQGSEERMAVSDVIRGFLYGRIQGPHALLELELMRDRLRAVLAEPLRWAVYVDSFQRLETAARQVDRLLSAVEEVLGDSAREQVLLRELAAVIDVELLTAILGREDLGSIDAARDGQQLARLLKRRAVKDLELARDDRDRLLELRGALEAGEAPRGKDLALLEKAACILRGRQIVDRLRTPGQLPTELESLSQERQLLLDSEDGLSTYLVLLYGQVQHRDLHLLEEAPEEVGLAERQLAVQEVYAFLARLRRQAPYRELEERLAWGAAMPASALAPLLDAVAEQLVPRLRRLASFREVEGEPRRLAERLGEVVGAVQDAEEADPELLAGLLEGLEGVRNLHFVLLPETPDEVEDPQDLLRRLGL